MEPILELADISYRYSGSADLIFRNFSLSVGRHEFVALVGGSGIGKSTILRIAAGLIDAAHGEVRVHSRREPGRRRRAMVFQDGRLMPWRTVWANTRLGLEGLELDGAAKQARIVEVLRMTGLSELKDRWPHQLSGGQVQRVGIARALAVAPDMLLMDEPFSAVDAITRRRLQTELVRIWQDSASAVLFVTHDIEEAVFLADRVIVLGGSPAEVVAEVPVIHPRAERHGSEALVAISNRISEMLGAAT